MEEFQIALEKAKKTIQIADHMLIMTFPMVKDTKILLAVTKNIFLSMMYALSSFLYLERLYKRIPPFQETFDSKMNMFKDKLVTKHNINKEYLKTIQELKELLSEHKKSSVEFSRADRFVICSHNYRMKTITVEDLKKYIAKTKLFIADISKLVNKNAGIFK